MFTGLPAGVSPARDELVLVPEALRSKRLLRCRGNSLYKYIIF